MLFRGTLGSEYSGKIDGLVAATNRGTPYFRTTGPAPVPPGGYSAWQLDLQAAMTAGNSAWAAATADFRDRWAGWAARQVHPDRVARRHTRTGFNEFIRWYVPRAYSNTVIPTSLSLTDAPGEDSRIGLAVPPTASFPGGRTIYLHFDDTAGWCSTDNAALFLFVSQFILPTRNRPYGGFTLAYTVVGDFTTPPTSPVAIGTIGHASDFRLFVRARVTHPTRGMSFATQTKNITP